MKAVPNGAAFFVQNFHFEPSAESGVCEKSQCIKIRYFIGSVYIPGDFSVVSFLK